MHKDSCKYHYLFIQIQLFSASHVVFKNNLAETGGAISVFTPIIYKDINLPFYFNTLCFIQYQILISDRLAPEKWEVCALLYASLAVKKCKANQKQHCK